jgi:hypothetical protein
MPQSKQPEPRLAKVAVVANEVKELAKQTNAATEDIRTKIAICSAPPLARLQRLLQPASHD